MVEVGATSLLGGEEFVASGIVDDSSDALALVLERHGDAKDGEAVGEIGGAIERVDVPAVVAAGILQAALFAENVVRRPVLTQALADQDLGFAVSDGNEVSVALVFDGHVAVEVVHEQGAGFAGNLGRGGDDIGPGGGGHALLALAAIFSDVHDFVFEDEEIGFLFASKADHVLVVVLDPAVYDFSIGQLYADWFLLFGEGFQVCGFFGSFLRRRGLWLAGEARRALSMKCHENILHGEGLAQSLTTEDTEMHRENTGGLVRKRPSTRIRGSAERRARTRRSRVPGDCCWAAGRGFR